ncbi:SMI1/KNR4 family protein, partial [Oleiphilus sp. HI0132]|uniref:SMI1/KNR4 family protein n=1 Tax=Oleiphilus sp. HI0132 TaxID=1822270 RepID=UPI000A81B410
MEEIKEIVKHNVEWLKGVHPETEEDLVSYESKLGFKLPTSMKWLLNNYGYSTACGVENLEESVIQTVECRDSINLPNNVLIINDWGDGGVVFCIADD